ncbi:MAG: Holliday junction branch migration protein RuvA [bacterium]|nr:Holliday junction branch migration protein RuvA [bacterium]
MIASINGILAVKKDKYIVIETGGIGYKVFVSGESQLALPKEGVEIKLRTVHHVREDAMELYGFVTETEKNLFELLNTVSGIGPKAAMNILGAASPKKLSEAIAHGDEAILTTVSGIGKKLAGKIIMELKDKMREEIRYEGAGEAAADMEVFEALRALGYGERQIQEALRKLPVETKRVEEKIKIALKMLGR